jgi:DNA-binding transcriptional MerR regulator
MLYSAHLSSQTGRKKRLYTDQDIETFRQVKDLSSHNFTIEQIGSRLAVVGDGGQDLKDSSLALIPSIAARFEQLEQENRSALSQIAAQDATIDQLKTRLEQLSQKLEQLQTKDNRPWYKRLFD